MTTTVKVIEDSISPDGVRLVTLEARYWRAIHPEYMTHRAFSRNAGSSRAIPLKKQRADVRRDPAHTNHWGANNPGMQSNSELTGWRLAVGKAVWFGTMHVALFGHYILEKIGAHKQWANRLIEPWSHITIVWTGTDWENFFTLRLHTDAEPNMRELALCAREAIKWSKPTNRRLHLPYVTEEERAEYNDDTLMMLSAARCARTSYVTFDRSPPKFEEDKALAQRLTISKHMSPFEHQAMPTAFPDERFHNLRGWLPFRWILEGERAKA